MPANPSYHLPETQEVKRNYLSAVLTCRCPRCRQGRLFLDKNPYHLSKTLKMHKSCPVCGQPTEIEVGFYTGAAYVSYAITVAIATAVFVAWYVLIGFSLGDLNDYRIFWCLLTSILVLLITTPYTVRLSRILWLSFFVHYDRDWKSNQITDYERVNPIGMEQ